MRFLLRAAQAEDFKVKSREVLRYQGAVQTIMGTCMELRVKRVQFLALEKLPAAICNHSAEGM